MCTCPSIQHRRHNEQSPMSTENISNAFHVYCYHACCMPAGRRMSLPMLAPTCNSRMIESAVAASAAGSCQSTCHRLPSCTPAKSTVLLLLPVLEPSQKDSLSAASLACSLFVPYLLIQARAMETQDPRRIHCALHWWLHESDGAVDSDRLVGVLRDAFSHIRHAAAGVGHQHRRQLRLQPVPSSRQSLLTGSDIVPMTRHAS